MGATVVVGAGAVTGGGEDTPAGGVERLGSLGGGAAALGSSLRATPPTTITAAHTMASRRVRGRAGTLAGRFPRRPWATRLVICSRHSEPHRLTDQGD